MKSKKNIWIINQYSTLPSAFGSTRHYDLTSFASKEKFNFYIFTSSFNNFERKDSGKCDREKFVLEKVGKGVKFIWIKTPPYRTNGFNRMISIFMFCREILKTANYLPKPDLIIGSSPQLLSAYCGLVLAKKFSAKFIFEVRDIWPDSLIELGLSRNNPLIIIFKVLEKRLMLNCDHIIAVMPLFKKYAKNKFNINSSKITWIPNGINDNLILPYQKPSKKNKFTVTYAGTIGVAQDLQTLIHAAYKLRKYKIDFKIIGNGALKTEIESLISSYRLSDSVHLIPPVSKYHLRSKLIESDILFLSLKESAIYKYGCQPNKLFDYLSAARPIVISGFKDNNPLKNCKCHLSCPSGNQKAIASTILKVYNFSEDRRKEMSLEALRFLKKNYKMSHLSKIFQKMLDKTINE